MPAKCPLHALICPLILDNNTQLHWEIHPLIFNLPPAIGRSEVKFSPLWTSPGSNALLNDTCAGHLSADEHIEPSPAAEGQSAVCISLLGYNGA